MHDHSKLEMDEVAYFIQLIADESTGGVPNGILTERQKMLIELHWKRNRHHPEFFSDLSKMSEIDIMEMVCDWAARSAQYQNSLLEFVHRMQNERFHFDDKMFEKVIAYCNVLISGSTAES
jgi:hypothetical protein